MKMCNSCKQMIPDRPTTRNLKNNDTRKILKIMEKNTLNPVQLCSIIGVHTRTFYRWLRAENPRIKGQYFELLASRGYE